MDGADCITFLADVICKNLNISTDVYVQMNDEFNTGDCSDSVFAVSAEWFLTWQRFARGDSEGKLQLLDYADGYRQDVLRHVGSLILLWLQAGCVIMHSAQFGLYCAITSIFHTS